MKIRHLILTIISLAVLSIQNLFGQNFGSEYYSSPVDFGIYLAGNVGEIRSSHFHSGLDIKASKGIGSPISTVADGYISRIGVSPTGYGRVIYITHTNGETSVYGHMRDFRADISKWVEAQQHARKSFKVDLYPSKDKFKVTKGDIIGYLGNSGSSGGPHLHLEIRNSANCPRNINHYNIYSIKDNIPPALYSVTLYEQDTVAGVQRFTAADQISATLQKDGTYTYSKSHLSASRPFYLVYEVIDRKNGYNNTMGIYSLKQSVDGAINFGFELPWVSYTTSSYVKTFIEWSKQSKYHPLRAYVSENNKLAHYTDTLNRGIITPPTIGDSLVIATVLEDDNRNKTSVSFTVKRSTEDKVVKSSAEILAHTKGVKWDRAFSYTDSVIFVTIPEETLFDNAPLPFYQNAKNGHYVIGDRNIAISKSIALSVKAETTDKQLLHRALFQNTRTNTVAQATHNRGWLSGKISSFGEYRIVYDTVPPKVKYSGMVSGKLLFKASDNLSGIKKYDLRIDGDWVVCGWDPKTNSMYHNLKITDNKEHTFTLTVEDYCGGVTQESGKFKVAK